jgi:four helix bundle protein
MAANFKDLIAWQKAIALTERIYNATDKFPKHELYGLTSQIRRAAVSVPSNIAEGQCRFSKREFRHFLRDSKGSLAEIETQLVIACRRKYLTEIETNELSAAADEVGRIISGLINSLDLICSGRN